MDRVNLVEVSTNGKASKFRETLYAKQFLSKVGKLKCVGDEWFVWDGACWASRTRDEMAPGAMGLLPAKFRTARNARAVLDHVQLLSQVRMDSLRGFYCVDAADGAVLLNCANGLLRVTHEDVQLVKHDPKWSFTAKTNTKFVADAECPQFQKVFEEMLPDEADRQLFQWFCGNVLYPSARFERALICYGPGGSGKSTLAEAFSTCLGEDLVAALSMSRICDSKSYSLPKLRWAAVNLGTEIDTIEMDESTNYKLIVSGEHVEARSIYGKPFSMKTACKLWFLANTLPRFKSGTDAEIRRTRFIRFAVQPKVKDLHLKDRLAEEREGILRWAVAALQEILATHSVPDGGKDGQKVLKKFSLSNDPVGYFVKNECSLGPDAWVEKERLDQAFEEWCNKHGEPSSVHQWFFRRLYERFTDIRPGFKNIDNRRTTVVKGLRLRPVKTEEEEEAEDRVMFWHEG